VKPDCDNLPVLGFDSMAADNLVGAFRHLELFQEQ
jgi:hypothetical protein